MVVFDTQKLGNMQADGDCAGLIVQDLRGPVDLGDHLLGVHEDASIIN